MFINLNFYLTLFLALIINFTSGSDEEVPRDERAEVPFARQQLQFLSLYNNLNFCLRDEDNELQELSETFNPLENLRRYRNPRVVKSYFENLTDLSFETRFRPFVLTDSYLEEINAFLEVLWPIDDWDLFFKTTAYASQRMNTQLFYWAMNVLLPSKWKHLKSPASSEVFPQKHAPKSIIRQVNGNGNLYPEIVDEEDPETALRYWRNDPGYGHFYLQWHTSFPWWLNGRFGIKKGRRGELFMYLHHNIMNRYKAERLSLRMGDVEPLSLVGGMPGDVPETLNVDLTEMPSREPNSVIQGTSAVSVQNMMVWQDRLRQDIVDGYFKTLSGGQIGIRNNSGNEYLGSTIWPSTESVNLNVYGELNRYIHSSIADIGIQNSTHPGIQSHPEQSIQDPAFYSIYAYMEDFNKMQQHKLPPYTTKDLQFTTVDINSIRVTTNETSGLAGLTKKPILTTYFEKYTFDISNALKSCRKVNSGRDYTATIKRLNYQPFDYKINTYSRGPKGMRAMVRIYMSPVVGFNGKPQSTQDLYWNMFEMDRFPVTLKRGRNVIERSSLESSVTTPTAPGIKELANDVKAAVSNSGQLDPYTLKEARNCGWPQNLLLPRGTVEGMKFKLFVIISSNSTGDYDEDKFPNLPFCGNPNGKFPDKQPMGFPFNRRYPVGSSLELGYFQNYKFTEVTIKHLPDVEEEEQVKEKPFF